MVLSNTLRRWVFRATCLGALVPSGPATLVAQVGHPPGSSPYRDLRAKYMISATGGRSWGTGGKVGVGPADGTFGGIRVDLHLGGPGDISGGLTYGRFDRLVLDPTQPADSRVVGTYPQTVMIADAGVSLVLTGEKTWHGIAPYFGASLGMAFGGGLPEDSTGSGFQFATRFTVGPQIGFRLHLGQRLFVRVEARDMIWQLSYPPAFLVPPESDPDGDPILDPETNKNTQWTGNPMVIVSLGFALLR